MNVCTYGYLTDDPTISEVGNVFSPSLLSSPIIIDELRVLVRSPASLLTYVVRRGIQERKPWKDTQQGVLR